MIRLLEFDFGNVLLNNFILLLDDVFQRDDLRLQLGDLLILLVD